LRWPITILTSARLKTLVEIRGTDERRKFNRRIVWAAWAIVSFAFIQALAAFLNRYYAIVVRGGFTGFFPR
jgi:hypothetical protein